MLFFNDDDEIPERSVLLRLQLALPPNSRARELQHLPERLLREFIEIVQRVESIF